MCLDFNIKPDYVGELISEKGLQTYVFEYSDNKVLKIPKNNLLNKITNSFQFEDGYKVVKKYLSDFIPKTEFLKSNQGLVIQLQDRIRNSNHFSLKDKNNVLILKELTNKLEMLHQNEHFVLDIIGGEAFWPFLNKFILSLGNFRNSDPRFSNILIDQKTIFI